MEPYTYNSLDDAGLEGFEERAPSPHITIADAEIVRDCYPSCLRCGAAAVEYRPFTYRRTRYQSGYRAFAVCRSCGYAVEF